MKKEYLRRALQAEVDAQALKSYDEFMQLDEEIVHEKGRGDNWYQVEGVFPANAQLSYL